MRKSDSANLFSWAKEVGVDVSEQQATMLERYVDELLRWNEKFNLTAITKKKDVYLKHIVDSLTLVPYIPDAARVLDVGTGAGLPGLVLAIMCPSCEFVLLDGLQKRIHFVQHVITELQLTRVCARHARVEMFDDVDGFDIITSRAFSQLDNFCKLTAHLVNEGGSFIAMKGVYSKDEAKKLPTGLDVFRVEKLNLPDSKGERSLVFIH